MNDTKNDEISVYMIVVCVCWVLFVVVIGPLCLFCVVFVWVCWCRLCFVLFSLSLDEHIRFVFDCWFRV